MVVDELLEKVNSNFRGGSLPHGSHCAAMAFADDLVMLSDSDVEAPLMLKEVETFLRERGMGVNPAKCRALCTGVIAGRAVGRTVSTYRINTCRFQLLVIWILLGTWAIAMATTAWGNLVCLTSLFGWRMSEEPLSNLIRSC
jgi:hypothetical protein